ncbi:hypothetical protein I3760_15G145200 [Carya illinoinensis]|nr:hypothetical protein I3760_15G145200 [Carya illinoinensis]
MLRSGCCTWVVTEAYFLPCWKSESIRSRLLCQLHLYWDMARRMFE